jgi:hypothetical protein
MRARSNRSPCTASASKLEHSLHLKKLSLFGVVPLPSQSDYGAGASRAAAGSEEPGASRPKKRVKKRHRPQSGSWDTLLPASTRQKWTKNASSTGGEDASICTEGTEKAALPSTDKPCSVRPCPMTSSARHTSQYSTPSLASDMGTPSDGSSTTPRPVQDHPIPLLNDHITPGARE